MNSNIETENEIIIDNNEEKTDSNNASIIMNIINETIESIEVPLNTNHLELGPESESSPSLQMKCYVESDEKDGREESSCHELTKFESIDDNVDNDNTLLDKNSSQTDVSVDPQTGESVKDMRHQYSKEQLIAISKLSLARVRPQCLDKTFNNPSNGLWDPEKWMSSRSPGNNSVINSSVKYNYNKRERPTDGNESVAKKANNDPQQRIIEEEKDNIILSPQRGSFGTGCHVSTTTFVPKTSGDVRNRDHHQHQERPKIDESSDSSHRSNSNSNHRRVGTGRIIPKERERTSDWTERSYERERDRNFDHRVENRDNNKSDDYNERRKGRLSYDNISRRGNSNSNRNSRYENDRVREHYRHYKEEDEPEWFTGGPTSKHETIELKGFEDEPEDRKCTKDGNIDAFDRKTIDNESNINNQNKRLPQKDINSSTNSNANDLTQSKSELKDRENTEKSDDFDVNNMFKIDDFFSDVDETQNSQQFSSMDGISNTATNDCDKSGKSRFKQWFKESPVNPQMAHFNDNSENDGNMRNAFKDKQTDISENDHRSNTFTNRSMPSTYQQSIPKTSETNNEKNIFDLLQGANRLFSLEHLIDQKEHKMFDPSKARNVSEIESSLKHLEISNKSDGQQINDKIAFEKLINELGRKSNPGFYERVNNIVDKQTDAIILPTSSSNIVIPKEQQKPRSAPTILELLKEDENQEAFEALANSQVKYWKQEPNSSMSQLNSSSAQMFNNINNMNVSNYSNTANALPTHNWHNTPQALINPMLTRIPSPQDLNDHTQALVRNALIQRQTNEMNKGIKTHSIGENIRNTTPTKGINNSKYSAFTPTSVILKMHSEKAKSGVSFDDMTGDVQTSQQKFISDQLLLNSNKLNMNSPRPIVKSNNPFGAQQQQQQQQQTIHSNIVNTNLSPQTNTFQFNTNSDNSFNKFFDPQQQQMLVQQQLQHQSLQSSQQASKARQHNSSSMPSTVRSIVSPLNLSTLQSGVMVRPSTLSPNANNNIQTQNQSIRNINQSMNSCNIRPAMNQFQQINQLMAIQQQRQQQPQHSTPNDSRQIQYSQSRALPSMNIQQMLFKTSNAANNQTVSNPINTSSSIGMSGQSIPQNISRSDNNQYSVLFNNQMDRNVLSNSEQLRTSIATTYQQSRPQNTFMSSGNVQSSRHLDQWFGNEMLNQRLANMPSVPLQNALTLEDLERP